MPAGIIGRRPRANRASRRKNPAVNVPQPTAPIKVTAATMAGAVMTITFDQAVALKGTPKYTTDVAGADAIGAVLTSPTTMAVTFDAAVTAATELRIPY